MDQLHKRWSVEQVKVVLQGYVQGTIARSEVEEMLQINKTRFFELLKAYRHDPGGFTLDSAFFRRGGDSNSGRTLTGERTGGGSEAAHLEL